MKKILFIVIDGLGDERIPELDNKTPLEAAQTPFMDDLAEQGMLGLAEVKFQGALPTSEEGHLSLFGYNPGELNIRRGLFTALGAGIDLKPGDVALRANFAYVENGQAVDRRAGRITDTKALISSLSEIKISKAKIIIRSAKEHRLAIVIRGENLSPQISDSDCWYSHLDNKVRPIKPFDESLEAKNTAEILNLFLTEANQILKDHPQNSQRISEAKPPANYIITRGASALADFELFEKKYGLKAACIAGKFLYQQVGKLLGMDLIEVQGADGSSGTNLTGKFKSALDGLSNKDFVFLHIKATDSLAEDGKFNEKRDFIEQIDQKMQLINHPEDVLIVITSDHSTCSLVKRHCDLPCPVLIWGSEKDERRFFSEKECQKGKFGKIRQIDLITNLLKHRNEA